MRGILADINIGKQRDALVAIWTSDAWRNLWDDLDLVIETFPALELVHDASAAAIWRLCQREGLILITANRNKCGPDSLEAVIQAENQPSSLPVITVANAPRILRDRLHAEQVAERTLEYLMRIDEVRGTGRIYVP